MSDTVKPTKVFWIVAALFILWNAFGCAMYLVDTMMSDAA